MAEELVWATRCGFATTLFLIVIGPVSTRGDSTGFIQLHLYCVIHHMYEYTVIVQESCYSILEATVVQSLTAMTNS